MPIFYVRLLTESLNRIFLLAVMFAVLWVKGYLWWVFGVALVLYLVLAVSSLNRAVAVDRMNGDDEDDDDPDEESETTRQPPLPPSTRPKRWREP